MFQDDEYINGPERYCYDNKEVTCQDCPSVIAKEGGPAVKGSLKVYRRGGAIVYHRV